MGMVSQENIIIIKYECKVVDIVLDRGLGSPGQRPVKGGHYVCSKTF